jgi:hypothetical protein
MSLVVAPIVEGHGDVAALPVLLRLLNPAIQVRTPVRFPKTKLLIEEHLRRAVRIAASNVVDEGALLVVIDADEDCAAQLARELQQRISKILPERQARVVFAVREFEAWIVGGIADFKVPDPDHAGHVKDRIREKFGVYKETVDQPRLIAAADVAMLTQRSRSFRRLRKVIDELVAAA